MRLFMLKFAYLQPTQIMPISSDLILHSSHMCISEEREWVCVCGIAGESKKRERMKLKNCFFIAAVAANATRYSLKGNCNESLNRKEYLIFCLLYWYIQCLTYLSTHFISCCCLFWKFCVLSCLLCVMYFSYLIACMLVVNKRASRYIRLRQSLRNKTKLSIGLI
jgi:hypothetical protein